MEAPKFPIRVRAAIACRIASLDRVKFNDACANEHYRCAPHTVAGSARIFNEADLLPLFFFARMTDWGIPAGRAGQLACDMARTAKDECAAPADRIIFVQCESDNFFKCSKEKNPTTGEIKVGYIPEHETTPTPEFPEGMCFRGAGRVLFTIDFYIRHVREIIATRLAYEASILGTEEGE